MPLALEIAPLFVNDAGDEVLASRIAPPERLRERPSVYVAGVGIHPSDASTTAT